MQYVPQYGVMVCFLNCLTCNTFLVDQPYQSNFEGGYAGSPKSVEMKSVILNETSEFRHPNMIMYSLKKWILM